jgi:phosphate transporter
MSSVVLSEPDRRRRISLSSSEGAPDLEASVSSLRKAPSLGRGTVSRIAGKLGLVRDTSESLSSSTGPETIWTAQTHYAYDTRLLFKRRIMTLYVSLTSLRSYVEVNYSGFRKILKK